MRLARWALQPVGLAACQVGHACPGLAVSCCAAALQLPDPQQHCRQHGLLLCLQGLGWPALCWVWTILRPACMVHQLFLLLGACLNASPNRSSHPQTYSRYMTGHTGQPSAYRMPNTAPAKLWGAGLRAGLGGPPKHPALRLLQDAGGQGPPASSPPGQAQDPGDMFSQSRAASVLHQRMAPRTAQLCPQYPPCAGQ